MKRLINWIKSLFRKYSYVFFVGSENALPEPLSKEEEEYYLSLVAKGDKGAKDILVKNGYEIRSITMDEFQRRISSDYNYTNNFAKNMKKVVSY